MIQKTPSVDIAIPYVYSYRTVLDENATDSAVSMSENVQEIPLNKIRSTAFAGDSSDIQQLSQSITEKGLIQPIVVHEKDGFYNVAAGHLRFEACKSLGWDKIAAIVCNSKQ